MSEGRGFLLTGGIRCWGCGRTMVYHDFGEGRYLACVSERDCPLFGKRFRVPEVWMEEVDDERAG